MFISEVSLVSQIVHPYTQRSSISNIHLSLMSITKKKRTRERKREREKDRLISRCFPAGIVVIIIQCNRRERERENAQLDLLQLRI